MSPTAQTAEPSDKEEAILEAALDLFAERGFHGTAVPEVARRAGVGAGTIYRYFDGKEALVNAVYRREKQALAAALMTDFPVTAPAREQFRTLFERSIAFALERRTSLIFLELHHHGSYLDERSRALSDQLRTAIGVVLEHFRGQQIIKDVTANALMAMVMGAVTGLLRDGWEGLYELTPELMIQAEEAVWELIRR